MCCSLGLRCLLDRWRLRGLVPQRCSTRPWFSPFTAVLYEIYNNCYFSDMTYGFNWGCVIRLLTGFFAFLSFWYGLLVSGIDPFFGMNSHWSEAFSQSFHLLETFSRVFPRPPPPPSLWDAVFGVFPRFSASQSGTYTVDMNGLNGSYTVKKKSIIPGFPLESLLLGLISGGILLWILQRNRISYL